METKSREDGPVKSTNTTFRIIEVLRDLDIAGVTEIANELDLAKSTVHDHLTTLYANEYIAKKGEGYSLGLKFYDQGMYVRDRIEIVESAKPTLKRVAEKTGNFVLLMVEEHGRAIYLSRESGNAAIGYCRTGKRVPIHCIAGGKAILAYLPSDRVEEIIDRQGLPKYTDQTITEPDELYNELSSIREKGFAINDEESKNGLRAVAAPIFQEDKVVGSLSVSGPIRRLSMDYINNELVEETRSGTNEIELRLSYESETMDET